MFPLTLPPLEGSRMSILRCLGNCGVPVRRGRGGHRSAVTGFPRRLGRKSKHHLMLHRFGHLCQAGGHCLNHHIPKPCYLTMEHQTSQWVDLYAQRQSPGDPLPINVLSEGKYQHCHWCGMQVNPFYPRHYTSKECQMGVERKQQQ